jgi:nucleotide-binding universal stress UspA family protein
VIVEVARTLNADVVVLGRGHDRGWRGTMKHSIARTVVHHLDCDTLVVAA